MSRPFLRSNSLNKFSLLTKSDHPANLKVCIEGFCHVNNTNFDYIIIAQVFADATQNDEGYASIYILITIKRREKS